MEKLSYTKNNVSEQLNLIDQKIKELSKKKFRYFIYGKYIPGFGDIKLIETKEELLKCFGHIKSNFNNENKINMLANELNLKIEDSEIEIEEETYLGYTYEEWKEEIQSKANEIQNKEDIENLKKSKKKLSKYLSEDDKFNNDFNSVESLLSKLCININNFAEGTLGNNS